MIRADLHCHSIYSEHPSEWFLQRLGAAESYTDLKQIYRDLTKRNMNLVTITDHNRVEGAVKLKSKHPKNTIMGLEATAYFPEDGCKVHILVYGLNEVQYDVIQSIRTDIYDLRDYLRSEGLAHSVAHATYSVNGKITIEHLEKLVVLFDVFETRNGGRNYLHNDSWLNVIDNLTPEIINELSVKHNIEPYSNESWKKGYTAGSDDHGGIFLGTTWTESDANTPEEFLDDIRNKRTRVGGRHNDFLGLAFTLYKIALDFGKFNSKIFSNSFVGKISEFIYNEENLSFIDRLKIRNMSKISRSTDDNMRKNISQLVETLQKAKDNGSSSIEKRFEIAYEKIADITDAFFTVLLDSFEENLSQGNLIKIIRNISSTLPGIFITLPFYSTINHLFSGREMLEEMQRRFNVPVKNQPKNILWFSDTIEDLNGVSATLKKVREISAREGYPIKVVGHKQDTKEDKQFVDLPIMHTFELPYYEHQKIKVPSPLKAMKKIYETNPDKIIISTPGPIGLLALLATKLFNIKSIGIYHTDFRLQTNGIKDDASLVGLVDGYTHWFYQQMDEVFVPSAAYIEILKERGMDEKKLKIFPRGVDYKKFYPRNHGRTQIINRHNISNGKIMLYTGRISHDKNLVTILKAIKDLQQKHKDLYLILAGDGPHRKELEAKYADNHILFTGKIPREELPDYYSGADLFLFPSTSDTFGMSVLEAQACCLPALVSNEGGPKEIISHKETGEVIKSTDPEEWKAVIETYIGIMTDNSDKMLKMKVASRENVMRKASWENFFNTFIN